MAELRVKEILNQKGISVRAFAEMIGVSREHCYTILKGDHISKRTVEAMAQALNMPIRDLYICPTYIENEYNPFEIVFGRTEHYQANDIITFSKLEWEYGDFSNMSRAYPVECCGYKFQTSEHLFIALRFSGYPKLQKDIMEYPNSMYCKKIFVNGNDYRKYHHPNWHDNLYDVEVMKYVVSLKYAQNKGFRDLLTKTKGKILVEDTTMQNTSNSVLRWGCQDMQKKDLVKSVYADATKCINAMAKADTLKTAELKIPRSKNAQERHDMKMKIRLQSMNKMRDLCEDSILRNCHYTMVGQNALGKILMVLRDNDGKIDYHLDYPLFLFDNEIK